MLFHQSALKGEGVAALKIDENNLFLVTFSDEKGGGGGEGVPHPCPIPCVGYRYDRPLIQAKHVISRWVNESVRHRYIVYG